MKPAVLSVMTEDANVRELCHLTDSSGVEGRYVSLSSCAAVIQDSDIAGLTQIESLVNYRDSLGFGKVKASWCTAAAGTVPSVS
jgi:hypothetical protein